MQATLDLYPESETETVVIAGRAVPLEQEPTAALAWGLQESPVWERELKGFFGSVFQVGARNQLVSLSPHRFGQIPVVFVHGTASSAGRWAEMINVLHADPVIRDRYDFWAFSYDTGNPILYSAMILRDALTSAVKVLDPEGKDPGLKQMVVIGHSQGGLLTKMTAISSGSSFYDAGIKKPIDQLQISEETRDLLRRAMFVEPLPFVKRVIFISTPHRGSFQAASAFVGDLLRRLISTPARLVKGTAELMKNRDAFTWSPTGSRLPTAVDNMSPRNPFIRTIPDHSRRPGRGRPLHCRRQGQRPDRVGRRRRRHVRERARRRREVRARREVGALGPGSARGHPGGPADPAPERRRQVMRTASWLRGIAAVLVGLVVAVMTAWAAGAIYYSDLPGARLRAALAIGFAALTVLAFLLLPRRRRTLVGFLVVFALLVVWWLRIPASNQRDWQPEVSVTPWATIDGDRVTIHGVRNLEYRTETDFVPHWEDRIYDLRKLDSVDLIAVYWAGKAIAHIMLSFGFEGKDYLAASIETRKERGESYSTIAGFFKQYELVYIVADERDIIGSARATASPRRTCTSIGCGRPAPTSAGSSSTTSRR